MKVIIAGSRSIKYGWMVSLAIKQARQQGIDPTEVVSGGAKGADTLGEQWAARHELPCRVMPAAWDNHGKSAGMIRNREMSEYADALIAVWDGNSHGTEHIIDLMHKANKPVFVLRADRDITYDPRR